MRNALSSSPHSPINHRPLLVPHPGPLPREPGRCGLQGSNRAAGAGKRMDWDRAVETESNQHRETAFPRNCPRIDFSQAWKPLGTITRSLISRCCFSSDPPMLMWACPVTPDKEQNTEDFCCCPSTASDKLLDIGVTNVSGPPSSIKSRHRG